MSDGHNRGRMLNWLTDPSLRKERVAKPLRPAVNLLLKHTADLLHSNDLVAEEWRNKRVGTAQMSGCASFSRRLNGWLCQMSNVSNVDLWTVRACDVTTRVTMHEHLLCVSEIVFTQSVESHRLYWMAPLIPGRIIILIYPSTLYPLTTISLANKVWNEMCCQVFHTWSIHSYEFPFKGPISYLFSDLYFLTPHLL